MAVGTLSDPSTGETFANVTDLLFLLKDAKANPGKYDKKAIERICGEITGRVKVKEPPKNPF